jgi:penicillin-binding protein 2
MFRKSGIEIEPDEIFLDSSNLPEFDRNQFEGRIEQPIRRGIVIKLGAIFLIIVSVMLFRTWELQAVEGEAYKIQSEINRLRHGLIFSERGVIFDKNGIELAWNEPSESDTFARRAYYPEKGFAHVLGYLSYPLKDTYGIFYQPEYVGIEGVEYEFNDELKGSNGLKIIEANARNEIESESTILPAQDGNNLTLSIDARVQEKLYEIISDVADSSGFRGGAGVIMDVHSGEILALTNYPEYDPNVLAEGGPAEVIASYVEHEGTPFLNRAISGLYAPGSTVKPIVALAALNENIIAPEKEILSTGSLVFPNPFDPENPTVFRDWKAHGYTDMREAIAVSSDVYFYEIGGGFEEQEGLGIDNIERYIRMFGIGNVTDIDLPSEAVGSIPSPRWKEQNFPGDPWRIGNTYHTSIGQYGFQITPIQMVRATAALANGGRLIQPSVIQHSAEETIEKRIPIPEANFKVIQDGMRLAVTDGTATALNFYELPMAAKTGTAEVGVNKESVHSWITGYFPYESPQYAFAIIMDTAPQGTLTGSVAVAQRFFRHLIDELPDVWGGEPKEEGAP